MIRHRKHLPMHWAVLARFEQAQEDAGQSEKVVQKYEALYLRSNACRQYAEGIELVLCVSTRQPMKEIEQIHNTHA